MDRDKPLDSILDEIYKNDNIENHNQLTQWVIDEMELIVDYGFVSIDYDEQDKNWKYFSPHAFIYGNPNLKEEYTNVKETYFNSFYIDLIKYRIPSNHFNVNLSEIISFIQELRIDFKKLSSSTLILDKESYGKHSIACKMWLNHLYSYLRKEENIIKTNIYYIQKIVSDMASTIMKDIFKNLVIDDKLKYVIYIDTDSIVYESDIVMSDYFHYSGGVDLKFHTDFIKKIVFRDRKGQPTKNIKHRKITW